MNMPAALAHWTADEVAECLDFHDPDRAIYDKLWGFSNDAEDPTPMGGDGTNGTVECPEDRLDDKNDDKAPHWWGKLTEEEQGHISDAYDNEYGD